MGDRLGSLCNQPPSLTQPPTLSGMGMSICRPICVDALGLREVGSDRLAASQTKRYGRDDCETLCVNCTNCSNREFTAAGDRWQSNAFLFPAAAYCASVAELSFQ